MSSPPDDYDFFVSYARADDKYGWITLFIEHLILEHRRRCGAGGRDLAPFFDRSAITTGADWENRLRLGLGRSNLFVAFISPNYLASEWCRREWQLWIDHEIAKHILTEGIRPIVVVNLPQTESGAAEAVEETARKIAELSVGAKRESTYHSSLSVLRQLQRLQQSRIHALFAQGKEAFEGAQLQQILSSLSLDLERHSQLVREAGASLSTIPPYNRNFSGRYDELLKLRGLLKDDRSGVVCGLHGLGGVGKSELAFTYAHAFASGYPGGRFLIPCEGRTDIPTAMLVLADLFRTEIAETEHSTTQNWFAAIARCLRDRLQRVGSILIILDNVTSLDLLAPQQLDHLTVLGPRLHVLGTTRLPPLATAGRTWLALDELPENDALLLLEKHKPFGSGEEREAARQIVRRLGGFTLALELVAVWVAGQDPSGGYIRFLRRLGIEELERIAAKPENQLRRHNHERRLSAVLGPVIDHLRPVERRALEYAALLPPDNVPLPWIEILLQLDYPRVKSAKPGTAADWNQIRHRLASLGLFRPAADAEETSPIARVHRLVQEVVRHRLGRKREPLLTMIWAMVGASGETLKKKGTWALAVWEIEAMEAVARMWADEAKADNASALLSRAANAWMHLHKWNRALPLLLKSVEFCGKGQDPESRNVGVALSNLAGLLFSMRQYKDAEPLYRRALEIHNKLGGRERYSTMSNLALLLRETGRLKEADVLSAGAFEGSRNENDEEELPGVLASRATVLLDLGRHGEAEVLERRRLQHLEQKLGLFHPEVADALANLALTLRTQKRDAEAEPLMRRALEIDEKVSGPMHPNFGLRLSNLAMLLRDSGHLEEGEEVSRRALTIIIAAAEENGASPRGAPIVLETYTDILKRRGKSQREIVAALNAIAAKYGVGLGEALKMAGLEPPALKAKSWWEIGRK